jgi:hypothetical protein
MLMIFFGDFLYNKYWGGYLVSQNTPGAPPTRSYVKLNKNPNVLDLGK